MNVTLSEITGTEILLLLVAFLLTVAIFLLIMVLRSSDKVHKLTYPVYDYIVKEAQHKAQEITYDAMKHSRELLVSAELEGVKVIAKEKLDSKKIEKEYEQQLSTLTEHTKKLLEDYTHKATHELQTLTETLGENLKSNLQNVEQSGSQAAHELQTLTKVLEEKIAANLQNIEQKGSQATEELQALTKTLEKTIADNLKKVEVAGTEGVKRSEELTQQVLEDLSKSLGRAFENLEGSVKDKIEENIEKEFDSVREMIDVYRKKRMDMVDSELIALIEQTTALALQKKLTFSEHSELLFAALEEAKSQNIFS